MFKIKKIIKIKKENKHLKKINAILEKENETLKAKLTIRNIRTQKEQQILNNSKNFYKQITGKNLML